jgi:hypothetical protein
LQILVGFVGQAPVVDVANDADDFALETNEIEIDAFADGVFAGEILAGEFLVEVLIEEMFRSD